MVGHGFKCLWFTQQNSFTEISFGFDSFRLVFRLFGCCAVLAYLALRSTMYSNCLAARYASHAHFWSLAKCSRGCFAAEWLQPGIFTHFPKIFCYSSASHHGSWRKWRTKNGQLPLLRSDGGDVRRYAVDRGLILSRLHWFPKHFMLGYEMLIHTHGVHGNHIPLVAKGKLTCGI